MISGPKLIQPLRNICIEKHKYCRMKLILIHPELLPDACAHWSPRSRQSINIKKNPKTNLTNFRSGLCSYIQNFARNLMDILKIIKNCNIKHTHEPHKYIFGNAFVPKHIFLPPTMFNESYFSFIFINTYMMWPTQPNLVLGGRSNKGKRR